jgi:hypothetical protein
MRFTRLAEKLNEWCDLQDIIFIAEDTILTVYSNGLFAGALHWSIITDHSLTMIVSLSDDPRHTESIQHIRLFLMRSLSALLPSYIMIRGLSYRTI